MKPLQAEVGGVGVGPPQPLHVHHDPAHVTEGNRLAPSSAFLDSERSDRERSGAGGGRPACGDCLHSSTAARTRRKAKTS